MLETTRSHAPVAHDIAARMMPVVRRIALQMARRLPSHVCVEDLVGAGAVGLAGACSRFDPARADGFASYAETRIRGAMLDELRASDPLSRDQRSFSKRAAAARRVLGQRLGREPRADEIAEHLHLTLDEYWGHAADASCHVGLSLDDDGDHAVDPQDGDAVPADERLAEEQARRAFHAAVEELPARLRQVVSSYCGERLTLREIGVILGVTESRVSQLVTEATQQMRARCARAAAERGAVELATRAARRNRARLAA